MRTPFPGMDPYLEEPRLWKQVHTQLIVEIQKSLAPRLQPNYYIEIEELIHLTLLPANGQDDTTVGIPDEVILSSPEHHPAATATPVKQAAVKPIVVELPVPVEIKHRYLQVRHTETSEVITAIEILSPTNKIDKRGREKYLAKREKILGVRTNLVEIDLLRAGTPLPMHPIPSSHYRILVSRSWQRPQADVYPFSVRDVIPDFPIPLQKGDTEPSLSLNAILHDLYEVIGYGHRLEYHAPPPQPALSNEDIAWIKGTTDLKTTR